MNTRWLAYVSALVALMVFGYACKGGGGGVTYLTVLQESPEDERTDVQVETRIGFQIDAPIDDDTLTSDNFFVEDSDGTRVQGVLSIDDDDPSVAIFNPDDALEVITTYTATITTELAATGGATLQEDFTWQFMTLDAEWGTSEWVEPSGVGRSDDQRIVVDRQSNALAVWEFTPDLAGSNPPTGIWSSRYTRVDLWGPPEQIDAGDGGSRKPALAADGAGNAFCVWEERKNDGSQESTIWANRYEVDLGWGDPERIQASVLPSLRPAVAADLDGNAIAIWVELEFPSNLQVVRSRRYEVGSGWGTNVAIDTAPNNSVPNTTDIQMDESGNAIALWTERTLTVPEGGSGDVLWANRYVAGEGWETARLIKSDPSTRAADARLGLGPKGEAHVVWVQFVDNPGNQTRRDIWTVGYTPGSNWDSTDWTEPERIDDYDIDDKGAPDIAVDGDRVAHAVWTQDDQKLQNDFVNIYANRYTEASGWGTTPVLVEPPTLDPRDDAPASQPRVGVNAAGNTFVVWRQDWENWGSIWSNRIDPGEDWVPENTVRIENIPRAARAPEIAVDDNRHAHAVWMHSVEAQIDRVRTNRFE